MKIASVLGSVLLATSSVQGAAVVPRDSTTPDVTPPPSQLTDLVEKAKESVLQEVSETEAKLRKRGVEPKCTASRLYYRQE